MKTKTQKVIITSMFMAIVCVMTMIIKIPSINKGYINLGDAAVLLSGWTLSPVCGFLGAGIGSALADIFLGYAIYAPVTFIIKGLMALEAYFVFKILSKKLGKNVSRVISGIIAELIMAVGYMTFEAVIYGMGASFVNILGNVIQGAAGLLLGLLLIRVFENNKIF